MIATVSHDWFQRGFGEVQSQLLQLMSDGEFHSGEELGRALAVSRAAIWKQLQKLETLGLPLESVRGRGYRLPGGLELLNRDEILAELDPDVISCVAELELFESIDSTNRQALGRAATGNGHGYVCTAEQQTAGRGRRGRRWTTPFAASVSLSVVWQFDGGAAALEGLSLAVGTAVVAALDEQGVSNARLKWPNDVLSDGRKLAGILLEMAGDPAGRCQVVIGIGVNVNLPRIATGEIDQPWIDANDAAGRPVSRNRLLAAILNHLMRLLREFERHGFAAFRQRWLELDAYAGRQIILHQGDEMITGVAAGVDATGALLVETPLGRRSFNGGEVTVRRLS